MRILDYNREASLSSICLLLTEEEIRWMIGYLEQLENNPSDHFHLMNTEELTSQGFAREITIARLDPPNPEIFDPVTRRLIME